MPSVADRTVYPSSTSEWVKPAARPVEIDDLIAGVDRYNPANVSFLEDYLYDQVKSGSYDCLANLATLKLYQFNPNLLNTDVLVHILLKTLIATPGPDFGLSVALIGDRAFSVPASEEEDEMEGHLPALLEFLTKAHSLLRTCQFSQFWKLLNGDEEAATILRQNQLAEHPLFAKLIRTDVVSKAVASTNQRISSSLLGKWLDLSGDELNKFITSELKWTIEGDVVTIGQNEDNDVKGKTVRENVELNQLTKVIAAGQR
ncbi:arm repeat-containing protein [Phaffia rhodozyma]|uniref:Eukaryotic translation initiation factor 3 subunit K n=1 Tax=Phaffia rhodozyma TaxID=264483 RepID=A0A0F7ST64_PHARH|nr:arm repeat-containing protein [Phaffia rhodozyma]